jgi:hypothetical protein
MKEKPTKKKPGWGGIREGAGRPPQNAKEGALIKTSMAFSQSLLDDMDEAVKAGLAKSRSDLLTKAALLFLENHKKPPLNYGLFPSKD